MIKRKSLGQHFLTSNSIAKLIVSNADITKQDVVYELGTGQGILTPLLCKNAKKVISVDIDDVLVENAKFKFSHLGNLFLKSDDGLKIQQDFDIFVSNVPYSKSKETIEWLAQKKFSHGVIMVQKEFAEKLIEKMPRKRKAISIIADHTFDIQILSKVSKTNFDPPPKIESVILKMKQKQNLQKEIIETINRIFSYRRKTVKNILKQFKKESSIDSRIDDLTGDEIVHLASQIVQKY